MLPSAGFAAAFTAADMAMDSPTTPRVPLFVLSALLLLVPLAHAGGLSDPFALPKSTLLQAGALVLLADAALRSVRGGPATRAPRLPVVLGSLFLLCAAASAALSANPGLAWRGTADLLALFVVARAASGLARDPARATWLFRSALVSATLVATGTLAQVFLPGWHVALAGVSILPPSAAGATLGDPGLVAQYLLAGLPFCIAAVAAARGVPRLVAGMALGLVAASLVFIGRPEGWMAAAIIAAVLLATRVVRSLKAGDGWSDLTPNPTGSAVRTAAVVLLVAIIVTALARLPVLPAPVAPLERVGLLAPTTGDPRVDRAAGVRGSAALLGLHPAGVGTGYWRHAFLEVAWTRVPASPFTFGHQALHAGNSLVELAAETGVAGGLLFAALLVAALVAAARTAFSRDTTRGDLAKTSLDTLGALVVLALFGSVFQEGATMLVASVALGLAWPAQPSPGMARRRAVATAALAATVVLAVAAAFALAARYQAARWTFVGQTLLSAGDPAAAVRALDRPAVAASPEHLPHALLGNAASRAGLHERAAAQFGAVLERSPWFIAALLGRAGAWTELGRYDRAETDLHSALAVWPDNQATVLALGRLNARRGRLEQALVELRRAAEIDRSQAEPWIAIGEIESRLGRLTEAIEAWRIGADRNPRHPRVNMMIGDAFEKQGMFEIALAFFQKAAAIDTVSSEPQIRLANVLNALGRVCEARDALAVARDLESDPARRAIADDLMDRLEPKCREEQARRR